MKYLQITNLALLALGVTLTLVLGVESLIYAVYLGADPLVARQLPLVLELTALLGVFSGAALIAWLGHRAQKFWRWPAQALPLIAAAVVIADLARMRGG